MVFHTSEKAQAGRVPSLAEVSAITLYSSETVTDVATAAVLIIYVGTNEVQVSHIAEGLLAG